MSFSFHIITYGCKVNQYESQSIRESWLTLGAKEEKIEDAQLILVIACAVTEQAISDARQMLRKIGRDYPETKIIVSGCGATAEPQEFNFKNVFKIIPQNAKWNLLNNDPFKLPENLEKEETSFPEFSIQSFERTRPVVKIQDGCSHKCSYCIVPHTRGSARTRDPDQSIAEIENLLKAGYREIVLSGINLRQYHWEKENFWDFLRKLHQQFSPEWKGKARFRLSSLEPTQLDSEGLETLEECTMLCPQLHLSLQSGSPSVLKRMKREHYSPQNLLDTLNKVPTFWHTFGLGADFLMGFAMESKIELEETITYIRQLPITYAHVFPYSVRKGTPAAHEKHLPNAQRQEHAAMVRKVIEEKKNVFLQSMLQEKSFYLSTDYGKNIGWNEYYVPCILENSPKTYNLLHVRPVEIKKQKILTSLISDIVI